LFDYRNPEPALETLREAAINRIARWVTMAASDPNKSTKLLRNASRYLGELSAVEKADPNERHTLYLQILEEQS